MIFMCVYWIQFLKRKRKKKVVSPAQLLDTSDSF